MCQNLPNEDKSEGKSIEPNFKHALVKILYLILVAAVWLKIYKQFLVNIFLKHLESHVFWEIRRKPKLMEYFIFVYI